MNKKAMDVMLFSIISIAIIIVVSLGVILNQTGIMDNILGVIF
jgi:hypothetical protein